jgi:hypothetical protein
MLLSSERCRTADTVFSDPVALIVDSPMLPVSGVVSHLGPKVGVGQVDTFVANITNPDKNSTYSYQWYVNAAAVAGETMPAYVNHNVFNNDDVSVLVTRTGACGGQSAMSSPVIVDLFNLGTHQVTGTNSDIRVLPNPSKGTFTVKGSIGTTNNEEVVLEITNMIGQVVYTGKAMTQNGNINERIQLSNTIASGMYLLSLKSASVNNVYHIVIEQ